MQLRTLAACALVASVVLGCGYSEEEWKAQLDKYNRLQSQHQTTEGRLAQTQKELEAAQAKVAELAKQLEAAGVDISKLNENLQATSTQVSQLSSTLEEREKARDKATRERDQRKHEAVLALLDKLTDDVADDASKAQVKRVRKAVEALTAPETTGP